MFMEAAITTPSVASITTVLTTIFVAPTPLDPLEVSSPAATTNATSEATQSTTPKTKRSTILLGLGVGLIIGVLMLVGIAGLYLWRRRRTMPTNISDSTKNNHIKGAHHNAKHDNGFSRFFTLRRSKDSGDTEWSIESASKVSIVKNVRAQSVLTRSPSKKSNVSSQSGVIPIIIPEEGIKMALTSHPLTPSYTGIPTYKTRDRRE
jgi:hypothetical protein